jgi:hypothetical protein
VSAGSRGALGWFAPFAASAGVLRDRMTGESHQ